MESTNKQGKRTGRRAAAPAEAAVQPGQWRDRWVRRAVEDPAQLLANELNWRGHPRYQQMAMEGVLQTLGWLDSVKVNINTGRVFNGHMRCELAISAGELVPVDYYDLTEAEERLALATFDPLSQLALVGNAENLAALADFAAGSTASDGLKALAAHAAGRGNIQAALATNFLNTFLHSTPGAVAADNAGDNPAGGEAAPGLGSAPDAHAAQSGGGAAGQSSVIVTEPQHVLSPDYLKVVFSFLPHQKKALFTHLNEQRVARNLPGPDKMTHAEVLLTILGIGLTDENPQS